MTDPHGPANSETVATLLLQAVAAGTAGDHRSASRQLRLALALAPVEADLWANLAIARQASGSASSAVACGQRFAALAPAVPAAWSLLATIAHEAEPAIAGRAGRRAVLLEPSDSRSWSGLGLLARQSPERSLALTYGARAVAIEPAVAQYWNNLGLALVDVGLDLLARACFEKAIGLDETLATAHANLAHQLIGFSEISEGLLAYRRAIVLSPPHPGALNGLAVALKDQSNLAPALATSRRALASAPADLAAARSYLACLLHQPGLTAETLYEAHRRTMGTFERAIDPMEAPANNRDPDRPLIVGYVSSDLRRHPIARYLKAGFAYRDRRNIVAHVYSDVRGSDSETDWYRANVDHWQDVRGATDRQVAEIVRRDRVDILVVPAGHFDDNRPLVAAYGAAPVQASIFAGTTTGVARMSHWFTDDNLHPGNTSERFTETLVRLPVLHCLEPPAGDPDIVEPPSRRHGFLTFGCFVNPARINPAVIRSWARILSRLPGAELMLKNRTAFRTPDIQTRFRQMFESHGVDFRRVRMVTSDDSRIQHQARYNDLDVVLDTFPFNGASASFDALWMGVPVVTLSGWGFVQRMTESLLVPLGFPELVARTSDEYEEIAVSLAARPDFLERFRREARQRIVNSPLCGGPAYAASLEEAYRNIWRRWCGVAG